MRYSYLLARHRRACKRTIFVLTSAAICAALLWQLDKHLSYAQHYAFVFDQKLSSNAQRAIAGTVEQLVETEQATPAQLIKLLHKKFSLIKRVGIFTIPGRHAIAKIIAHNPLCLLGDSHALLSSGTYINRLLLSAEILATTPHVEVRDWFANDGEIPSQLAPFLKSLGPEKMKEFRISWHGDHEVLLTDINTPTFCVMLEGKKESCLMLSTRCATIKELLTARGLLNTPRKRSWTADMRFKDQVIVFTGKRGEEHGSRSF